MASALLALVSLEGLQAHRVALAADGPLLSLAARFSAAAHAALPRWRAQNEAPATHVMLLAWASHWQLLPYQPNGSAELPALQVAALRMLRAEAEFWVPAAPPSGAQPASEAALRDWETFLRGSSALAVLLVQPPQGGTPVGGAAALAALSVLAASAHRCVALRHAAADDGSGVGAALRQSSDYGKLRVWSVACKYVCARVAALVSGGGLTLSGSRQAAAADDGERLAQVMLALVPALPLLGHALHGGAGGASCQCSFCRPAADTAPPRAAAVLGAATAALELCRWEGRAVANCSVCIWALIW